MAVRITYRASVSYESERKPVQTHWAKVVAPNAPSAARQALNGARRAFPGCRAKSIVVVLEEVSREEIKAQAVAFEEPSL